MTLAEYLAQFLKSQGITHLFGLPGGENVTVIEALRQADLDYVLTHHETFAGFAAEVTGQLTDRPGVCMSTLGPGAVNLVAAAAAATLERSPMLAITAEMDTRQKERATHMKLNLPALFGPVTKGSFDLRPESAGETLAQVWRLALAPPRGAVHLSISPDSAAEAVTGSPSLLATSSQRSTQNPVDVSSLRPHLERAGKLLIIAGVGVEAAAAQAELRTLAEHWQVPVAVTPKAKGHFPDSHPLYAGCYTAYGDAPLRRALADADLVLGVGLDGVDFVIPVWPFDTPVINLNLAGADDTTLNPIVALDGDLRGMLRALANGEAGDVRPQVSGPAQAAEIRAAITKARVSPTLPSAPGTIPIPDLIAALQTALPEEGAVTVDVGLFKLVFLQHWRTDRPKSLFVANGLAAMGYAIPGALGIRLSQPERPVVAIVGDGALLMYAGDLATIARMGQPLVILLIVDEALSLIRLKQLRQEVPIHGTEFGRTDYRALAAAFGLDYCLIDGQADAKAILSQARQMARPVLVEARVNKAEYDHFR